MNNNFPLQQISKTVNLDSNLRSRQYKVNLMAKFMKIQFKNPKLTQSEIANQLSYSSSTLKRYRKDINMVSTKRIQPNINKKQSKRLSNTNIDSNSHLEHEHKRRKMNPNEPKKTPNDPK